MSQKHMLCSYVGEICFRQEGRGSHLLPAPKPPMKKQGTGISRLPVRNSIVAASGSAESSAAPVFSDRINGIKGGNHGIKGGCPFVIPSEATMGQHVPKHA